ncbi:MAG: hypothetical protein V1750_06740 [Acidobacteriota bacterium]
MDSDRRRLLAVLFSVGIAVGGVAAWWRWRQAAMPRLVEVRVVLQGSGEAVASDRLRLLPAGSRVRAAAVVTFRRGAAPVRRICALPEAELDRRRVAVEPLSNWPASGGVLRATWYTVEPSLFGGSGVGAAQVERLAYKDFLAPEMRQYLITEVGFESHNDDFLAEPLAGNRLAGGMFRFKVRIGAYRSESDLVARESVASPGAGEALAGAVPGVAIAVALPAGVSSELGRHLRLGCFTFAPGCWPGGGSGWPLRLSPAELVAQGLIVTPQAVAAAAACGDPLAWPWREPEPIDVIVGGGLAGSNGSALRWGREVAGGDALRAGERFLTLIEDDGDGVLSGGDSVLFAWRQPARIAPLTSALGDDGAALELLRKASGS